MDDRRVKGIIEDALRSIKSEFQTELNRQSMIISELYDRVSCLERGFKPADMSLFRDVYDNLDRYASDVEPPIKVVQDFEVKRVRSKCRFCGEDPPDHDGRDCPSRRVEATELGVVTAAASSTETQGISDTSAELATTITTPIGSPTSCFEAPPAYTNAPYSGKICDDMKLLEVQPWQLITKASKVANNREGLWFIGKNRILYIANVPISDLRDISIQIYRKVGAVKSSLKIPGMTLIPYRGQQMLRLDFRSYKVTEYPLHMKIFHVPGPPVVWRIIQLRHSRQASASSPLSAALSAIYDDEAE